MPPCQKLKPPLPDILPRAEHQQGMQCHTAPPQAPSTCFRPPPQAAAPATAIAAAAHTAAALPRAPQVGQLMLMLMLMLMPLTMMLPSPPQSSAHPTGS
jgi:hypothetical protein